MKILLKSENSKKWEMVDSAEYTNEAELQELLAKTPSLIPLNEIRDRTSFPVFAVKEFGLPGSGNTDIIAFTPEGEIAILECKLASNPEVKRKVIGQIFEYAAFLWEMKYEDFDKRIHNIVGKSLAESVENSFNSPDWDEEAFRQNIIDSLSSGSFFLIIAVDNINEELSRIIKYLNRSNENYFHFSALEMKRFKSDKNEILVPHLYGPSSSSSSKASSRRQWTEEEFFDALRKEKSQDVFDEIKSIYEWTKQVADRVWFGTGKLTGSFSFHYLKNGKSCTIFTVYTNGGFTLNYGYLQNQIEKSVIENFHKALTQIHCFRNISDDFNKWPTLEIKNNFWGQENGFELFKKAVLTIKKQIETEL